MRVKIYIADVFYFRRKCYTVGCEKMAHPNSIGGKQLEKDLEVCCTTENDLKEPLLKYRYVVVLLGFFVNTLMNSVGLHMSVTLVAMVNNSATFGPTEKSDSCPSLIRNASEYNHFTENNEELKGEFTWSPKLQGYILGSLYFGCVLSNIPAGMLSQRFRCKTLLLMSSITLALSTLLIPIISRFNVYCLIFLQALRGLAQAFINPTQSVLAANWFPTMERGLLYPVMLSGLSAGSITGSILAGYLCEYLGWIFSFYIMGAAIVILSLCIAVFLYDSPKEHPWISKAELEYIRKNKESSSSKRKRSPPWRQILTSIPVYALIIAQIGRSWTFSHFLTVHPTYLGTILHYPIKQNGIFAAGPFLVQFLFSHIAGWLSSFMLIKRCASINFMRKFWTFMAFLGYAVCVLAIYIAGCNSSLSVIFGIICMAFSGFTVCGCRIVPNDMSPNFAGILVSIMLTLGSSSGFIIPLLIGYLTNEKQAIEQWNKFMFISAGVVMSSGIIFVLFGSAELQPWDDTPEEETPKERKESVTRF